MEHVVDVHRKVFVVAHRKNQVTVDEIQSPGSIINISAQFIKNERNGMKLGHRHLSTCDLYYKNITIINDTSLVVRMMPQLGASLTIIILMTLEVSFMLIDSFIMLLVNICTTGITHDDHK